MARPGKTVDVLEAENRSHRTKAEKAARRSAEKAFATGKTMKERPDVKGDAIAHAEFVRLRRLLDAVGKNDAMFEPIINRYCRLQSECAAFEDMRQGFLRDLEELREADSMDVDERYRLRVKMQQAILLADKQVQAKRRMMFDIEKECAMTISAAVRTVPKAPQAEPNPLAAILADA